MLRGKLAFKNAPSIILDVGGVGYKVFVSNSLLTQYAVGDEITLFTYTFVRDDVLELYGFSSGEDLKLFEMLIGVSGVGCKSALAVFSIGSRSAIVNAIIKGDVSFFTAVPRLGKKNSQKIIIELKNKLGGIGDLDLSQGETSERLEAMSALQSFGFSQKEAQQAIHAVASDGMKTEDIVRRALKELGK